MQHARPQNGIKTARQAGRFLYSIAIFVVPTTSTIPIAATILTWLNDDDLCVPKTLNPTIVVMQSTEDAARIDDTDPLNRARDWRILLQGSMCSEAIIIVGVGFQDPTQMHLAQDDDVVQTLTPDRSDQPFGKAVLPGRGWSY